MPGESDSSETTPILTRALGPLAEEFGREVQPLGKEVGEVTVRTVRLCLGGLRGIVWGFEQIHVYLQNAVSERLKDIPIDSIVEPNPRIAAPAVEALRYSNAEPDIRDMFANLIAADMNKNTKSAAHPSFVQIIKEMSSDDAKVLLTLVNSGGECILCRGREYTDEHKGGFGQFDWAITLESGLPFRSELKGVYSLHRLGLVVMSEMVYPINHVSSLDEYEKSLGHQRYLDANKEKPGFRFERSMVGVYLTPHGRDFAQTCL